MNATTRRVFENQGYHLLVWMGLGALLSLESRHIMAPGGIRIWGWPAGNWILVSWIFAALHQGWVWFFWRLELYRGRISRWFGSSGFLIFKLGFVLFASIRLLSLVPISLGSAGTLPMPRWLSLGLIVLTAPAIGWGLFSVVAFFGITRAFGADHFDPKYRGGRLERRGIFRYVPNAMYTVVLLALYHPGLLVHSGPGLVTALAHHLFVWTHYFCTERPDMKEIYGVRAGSGEKGKG